MTRPRYWSNDTRRPCWSVSVKSGALGAPGSSAPSKSEAASADAGPGAVAEAPAGAIGRPIEDQDERAGEHDRGREAEQEDARAPAHGRGIASGRQPLPAAIGTLYFMKSP